MLIRAAFLCALALMPGFFPGAALAGGWALDGMDAVAYHSRGAAVEGESGISTQWAGKEWHFESDANRTLFEADPRAYAPGFKGHCPVALAQGRVIEGKPRYFAMVGKRLYLMQSEAARRQFLQDPEHWLAEAKAASMRIAQ